MRILEGELGYVFKRRTLIKHWQVFQFFPLQHHIHVTALCIIPIPYRGSMLFESVFEKLRITQNFYFLSLQHLIT